MKVCELVLIGGMLPLAACGQQTDNGASNVAASNTAAQQTKHAYCFFKDDEMKGWTAVRESDGSIKVEGKAHVKDPRYKATISQSAIGPKKVIINPTIGTNDTGYAKPDDWWDLSVTVPNTASLTEAVVQCGDKTVADLQVPLKS